MRYYTEWHYEVILVLRLLCSTIFYMYVFFSRYTCEHYYFTFYVPDYSPVIAPVATDLAHKNV
jgi:hypothetical protein